MNRNVYWKSKNLPCILIKCIIICIVIYHGVVDNLCSKTGMGVAEAAQKTLCHNALWELQMVLSNRYFLLLQ